MSIITTGISVLGRLVTLVILLAAFMGGMVVVVLLSLSGTEIKVPEIVGKDYVQSEKELEALGLKIKKRAERPSSEKINTILEQLPHPGETVKSGQMILVVVSRAGSIGEEAPKSLIKDIQADDTEKIEEMISEKPKKSKANTNSNSETTKVDTTRDVIANTAASNTETVTGGEIPSKADDLDRKDPGAANTGERGGKALPANAIARPPARTAPPQPSNGETRPRTANRP